MQFSKAPLDFAYSPPGIRRVCNAYAYAYAADVLRAGVAGSKPESGGGAGNFENKTFLVFPVLALVFLV